MSAYLVTQLTAAEIAALTPDNGMVVFNTTTDEFQLRQAGSWIVVTGGIVSSVGTGTGLTGGPITSSGTISLANTAVTPGSYTSTNLTVNAQGQITAASSGSASGITYGNAGPLVAGVLTVNTTSVTATSSFSVTYQTVSGIPGSLSVSASVVGTSFTVTSTSNADTSTFYWSVIN